jgi:hypothetical protein
MPDFESGAFNRALPPLRCAYSDLEDRGNPLIVLVAVPFALTPMAGKLNHAGRDLLGPEHRLRISHRHLNGRVASALQLVIHFE